MKHFLTLLISGLSALAQGQGLPSPSGTTVEFLRDPAVAVVTDTAPEFGWFFPSSGGSQKAY